MMMDGGWIPQERRTKEQMELTEAFAASVGVFSSVPKSLPERVIFEETELKFWPELLPRVWQTTGSCVGAGAAAAYVHAAAMDYIYRDDQEAVKLSFPYYAYGIGRQIAGMNGRGEGSFGAAQAKAVEQYGMLPYDFVRMPQPQIRSGHWWKWTSSEEFAWSHPRVFPIPLTELRSASEPYRMHKVTRIQSPEQWKEALASGYSVTLASMFGTRNRVEHDVLLGRWNDSWAHQMSSSGYWEHPRLGLIFKIDNQWGPSFHGWCPTLKEFGVNGSFWMLAEDARKVCSRGEVFAHSHTGGFETREGLFDDGGHW